MEIKQFSTSLANSYLLVEGETALLIDPVVKLDKLADYKISHCFATHGHADHIAEAKKITDHFQIPLYLHKDETIFIKDDTYNLSPYILGDSLEPVENLRLLTDQEKIDFQGHLLETIHTPGHTKGSVMYLLDNKHLFSGDTLFKESIGRTDLKGGNQGLMAETLTRLLSFDQDWLVYPGHGESTTFKEVKKVLRYWRRLI